MSFDGGFGAAVYVREGLINDVVKAMHFRHGDAFRASISQTLTLDGTSVVVSGVFYVEAPHVTLRAADGRTRVALSGWARLRLQAEGADEACLARLTAELLVPITLDEVVGKWDKQLFLDLSQFEIVSASVAIPWTSVVPGAHAPALALSAPFRQLLLDAVRPMAQRLLRVNVPISMLDQMESSLLIQQQVFFFPQIRPAAVKVLDGALAVGLDLFSGPERETSGDVNALELPWTEWATRYAAELASAGIQHIAVSPDEVQVVIAILPAMLLRYGGLNITLQVRLQAAAHLPEDKRIDEVTLGLAPGAATLLLKMTDINDDPSPDGHIQALVSIVPLNPYIHLLSTNVVFQSGGIVGLIDFATDLVTKYVRSMAKEAIGGAVRQANWLFAMARFAGDLPGAEGSPGQARVLVTHEGTVLDPGLVLAGIGAKVLPVHARNDNGAITGEIDDPDVLPGPRGLGGRVPIRAREVRGEVPDHPTLRRDPSLRTAWSVLIRRQDGTTGEFSQDRWSADPGARALAIDLWSADFYLADRLEIRCAHYRPPNGPDLAAAPPAIITVVDRFKRNFPFVRWHREIGWTALEDGESVQKSKIRMSAVHKTDIRQRCKFCDAAKDDRKLGSDGMEHFAALPPAAEDGFRVKLCEYCFGHE
jgi:hypothetical protein